MHNTPSIKNLAVLIDADNTSPNIAESLFAEIATIGAAGVRRIYGDFTSTRSKQWNKILALVEKDVSDGWSRRFCMCK